MSFSETDNTASDFDRMQQDPDLAVLHNLREFEGLMYIPPPPPLAE